jgi:Protein of unknown function (DUF3039)
MSRSGQMLDAPTPAQAPAEPGTTAVLEREEVVEPAEPGDHERFAHYVRKEKIVESAVTGTPVIALCGKVWIPGRDPKRFPVCPTCKEIYEGLRPGGDSGSGDSAGGAGASGGAGGGAG